MLKSLIFTLSLIVLCASNPLDPKIVGGDFAKENQFPHQIALYNKGSFRCGGSIFNENWIISAAHCVESGNGVLKNLTIRAGSLSIKNGGVTRRVIDSFFNEKYGNFENDIALMRLGEPLEFSDAIQPIEIATEEIQPKTEVIISGWGTEYTGGFTPTFLKFNTLKVLSKKECGCPMSSPLCYKGVVCLGHSINNGACNGDSGGPAISDGKLIGVANFVVGGCGSTFPDGYAKVSFFHSWITEKIAKYEEEKNSKISFL